MKQFTIPALMLAAAGSPAAAQLFTFDTADDFITPLVNGQMVSAGIEFSSHFSISSGGGLGAAIFDSGDGGINAGTLDPDLLVDLGNILIVQNTAYPDMTTAGIFDIPNDEPGGGNITFNFTELSSLLSIDLIDIDRTDQGVAVVLTDIFGLMRTYDVADNWSRDISIDGPDGYDTLSLTTLAEQVGEGGGSATASEDAGFDPLRVASLSVTFNGSGGLDNLWIVPAPGPAALLVIGGLAFTRRR